MAGPRRSSRLLALLMLVGGRDGGPLAGGTALPFEALLLMGGGIERLPFSGVGPLTFSAGLLFIESGVSWRGGVLALLGGALNLGADVGAEPGGPLADLGGPARGGGGVPEDGVASPSFPPFLFTHLFKSGS